MPTTANYWIAWRLNPDCEVHLMGPYDKEFAGSVQKGMAHRSGTIIQISDVYFASTKDFAESEGTRQLNKLK